MLLLDAGGTRGGPTLGLGGPQNFLLIFFFFHKKKKKIKILPPNFLILPPQFFFSIWPLHFYKLGSATGWDNGSWLINLILLGMFIQKYGTHDSRNGCGLWIIF
jgi:hypothetical protein